MLDPGLCEQGELTPRKVFDDAKNFWYSPSMAFHLALNVRSNRNTAALLAY